MTPAAFKRLQRRLHELRVETYAVALFDTGPKPLSNEMTARFREHYREVAERKVTEYERAGVFTTGIERVA